MPPTRNAERMVLIGLSAMALVALAILAWRAVGWLGVGVLGLLVLFIAVRVELEGNRPVGPQMMPGLYADQYRSEMESERAARAGGRAERLSVIGAARIACVFGAALALTGFGLFLLL